jgi:ABC-type enterochelin transport system permease subunit
LFCKNTAKEESVLLYNSHFSFNLIHALQIVILQNSHINCCSFNTAFIFSRLDLISFSALLQPYLIRSDNNPVRQYLNFLEIHTHCEIRPAQSFSKVIMQKIEFKIYDR